MGEDTRDAQLGLDGAFASSILCENVFGCPSCQVLWQWQHTSAAFFGVQTYHSLRYPPSEGRHAGVIQRRGVRPLMETGATDPMGRGAKSCEDLPFHEFGPRYENPLETPPLACLLGGPEGKFYWLLRYG